MNNYIFDLIALTFYLINCGNITNNQIIEYQEDKSYGEKETFSGMILKVILQLIITP